MKKIKEDIKTGVFSPAYLISGQEAYLKHLYRNKLKAALLGESDEMNFSFFEGKGIDETEVVHIAETMPFFADRRVILIENSGWFKSQNSLAEELKNMPETTFFIFVENEVDKRNRLYKAVREIGYVCEINAMEERDLKLWVASLLKADERKILDSTMNYLLEKVGTDMEKLRTEVEKLIGYTMGREVITPEDIDAVCSEQITGRIFQMIDFIATKNAKKALQLYYDLLVLREKPMSILYLIIRQFNILMQMKQMKAAGLANAEMAKKVGIPPFSVNKYLTQAKVFSSQTLLLAVQFGTETEELVKTGRLNEQIAVEIMIVKFAAL